jgi:hypothetical protein
MPLHFLGDGGRPLGNSEQLLAFHLVTDRRGGRRVFNSLMMLAFEANGVVALRMMKLMS